MILDYPYPVGEGVRERFYSCFHIRKLGKGKILRNTRSSSEVVDERDLANAHERCTHTGEIRFVLSVDTLLTIADPSEVCLLSLAGNHV
jgi:predicted MarR family transcription regulator